MNDYKNISDWSDIIALHLFIHLSETAQSLFRLFHILFFITSSPFLIVGASPCLGIKRLQIVPVIARPFELLASLHVNNVLAVKVGFDCADVVEVHDIGAVDAHKICSGPVWFPGWSGFRRSYDVPVCYHCLRCAV